MKRRRAAALVERALNAWLATDPEAARKLSELEGVVIGLEVTTFPLELFFLPAAGRVRVAAEVEREPHTWIRGGVFDLMKLGLGGRRPGAGARLVIAGDVAAGHAFQHVLKAGDFDWEELLAQRLGDVAAHELARGARAGGRWARRSVEALNVALGEYLQEEAQWVAGAHEVSDFIRGVDALRDRVERLEIRARRPAREGG